MNLKRYILLSAIAVSVAISSSVNAAFDYSKIADYSNLKDQILYRPYGEYKALSSQNKKDSSFDNGNVVTVDTVFDFYKNKFREQVETKRDKLLEKMKNREPIRTGETAIDKMISKLETGGKYVVVEIPGDVLFLSEDQFLLIKPHRILGEDGLIDSLRKKVDLLRSASGDINKKAPSFQEIYTTLEKYGINYTEVHGSYLNGKVSIGKKNYSKASGEENFFISTNFTTPILKEEVEKKKKIALYAWTYLSNDELAIRYGVPYAKMDGNEVFVNLFQKPEYVGTLSISDKFVVGKAWKSNGDIFIYSVKKSPMEYPFLAFSFIIGLAFGAYLVINFINNFRNNFKKTPEEI